MSVRFTRARLHVGYRAKDWSDVWFEPDEEKNNEGEAEILLYKLTVGKAEYREPMEGEVNWHPPFDDKNCESKSLGERKKMQRQFLTDAYVYLVEKDAGKVRDLEAKLDQPGFSRWQTWFKEAKKFKKVQMRQRTYRRKNRVEEARSAGATEAEIRKQVNSDSSDSAYESDEEVRHSSRRSNDGMPPPPRPKPSKRTTVKKGANGPARTKKQRLSTMSHDSNTQSRFHLYHMSGGNGKRTPSVFSSNVSSRDSSSMEFDDEMMDTSDPNRTTPAALGNQEPWNFDDITPPSTVQDLRNSILNGERAKDEDHDYNNAEERGRRHARDQGMLGMDDEASMEAAIRASLEPQGMPDENEISKQEVTRANMESSGGTEGEIVESIEEDADDS